jgi:hypothetical protein
VAHLTHRLLRSRAVTERTVSNYLYRIFEKLEVSSRVQLIQYAMSRNQPASAPARDRSPGSLTESFEGICTGGKR